VTGPKRVTIAFRGGPLDGVILDSRSASGPERWDVTWLLAKTRDGRLSSSFREPEALRSLVGTAVGACYELVSRGENADERQLGFVFREQRSPDTGQSEAAQDAHEPHGPTDTGCDLH